MAVTRWLATTEQLEQGDEVLVIGMFTDDNLNERMYDYYYDEQHQTRYYMPVGRSRINVFMDDYGGWKAMPADWIRQMEEALGGPICSCMILHWYSRVDLEGEDPATSKMELEEEKDSVVAQTIYWLRAMHEIRGWPTILCHSDYGYLTIIRSEET